MTKINVQTASPQWATSAMEIFKGSLNENDIEHCKNIIADVLDAGHYRTAREMNQMMRDNYRTN